MTASCYYSSDAYVNGQKRLVSLRRGSCKVHVVTHVNLGESHAGASGREQSNHRSVCNVWEGGDASQVAPL